MGFGGLGVWEILLIFLVVLLLFGAKRLPEIGSSLGKGIREFKSSIREIENEINAPEDRRRLDEGRRDPGVVGQHRQGQQDPAEQSGGSEGGDGEPRRLSGQP